MSRLIRLALFVFLTAAACQAQVTAIRAGRLIDPETGTAPVNQVIRGRLQLGTFADIIATPGDPLRDINELRRVRFVMKEGPVYRHDR